MAPVSFSLTLTVPSASADGSETPEANGSPTCATTAAAGKPALASKAPKEAVKTKGELLHDRKSRAGKGSLRGSKKNGAGASLTPVEYCAAADCCQRCTMPYVCLDAVSLAACQLLHSAEQME